MPHSYLVHAHSRSSPGPIFGALLRAATWPVWSPVDAADIEGGGDPAAPQQVGDIRIFRTGRVRSRERISGLVPDRRFAYENLGGPFRFYDGVISLSPSSGGGTDIAWTATFEPKIPFTGGFWEWFLGRHMQRMATGLAAYAEHRIRQ